MKKGLRWKVLLTLGALGLSLFLALPLKEKIKLGLDLKGGIHLVLQVMTDDALNGETDQEIIRFTDLFKKNSIRFTTAAKEKPGRFVFTGLDVDQQIKARDLVAQYTRDWDASFMADRVTFTLKASAVTFLKDQAVVQTVETIRNRIDQFGVSEPLIQRQGENQIVVELPGVDDPERVKDLIKVTAVLEWKLVKAGPAEDEATLLQSFGGTVPDDAEIVRGDPARGHPGVYLVEKVATVSGKDLRMVRRGTDEWGNPAVSFTLSSDGGRRFEQVTGANIGRALAIILDDRVQSAPNINARIGDSGIIQGQFTIQQADDLVVVLKAGALPAGIKYLEERMIGPALGSDSIRQGMAAGLVAILLVMTFMVVYYRLSGVNAVIAMILNVVILFGVLAYFKANLTLPGIAGLILAIGMSVDANVLIFERIKEERALGKNVPGAISLGFSRAFTAIFDSNLTTIISAVFLFQFGTGPIKGYAVTLIISLVANMFTAVFVSRLIFDLVIPKTAVKLSI
ncbi:MAG: protein translocase subunit SecD [Acidobacteriota bacterium]|nr:protein translocase subunit SecD [Acidobacteriota bacterium]OQB56346.1 MAG: preprotein translocase subunit SecD [Candidatus Aminicenantes bacterium ADurb.Bin147]HNQ81252.1 protein translocase subunit SecD [Candidatus Aminicenantes bacterium]MDW3228175.1 protein translocase subunit SecD [Acidobacteriota bacterium]HNT32617.1 protein translocase subunit SecD [Candidatus Aminicenantes bacterium]